MDARKLAGRTILSWMPMQRGQMATATWREQAIEVREAMHRAKLDRRAALRRERKYGPHLPFFGEPA